jgi:branched-chain amino acid transport system ATP-binding protein
MLTLKNVEVVYDDVILVLKGLSLHVPKGKIVALLGSNGAGKSTTLKAISGLLHAEDGEVTDGGIELDGERIDGRAPEEIVKKGVFQVMEGRRVFEDLTVDENIVMGGYTRSDRAGLRRDHEAVFEYFPRLKERRGQLAGYLSGG